MQESRNSSALAMELRLSCINRPRYAIATPGPRVAIDILLC